MVRTFQPLMVMMSDTTERCLGDPGTWKKILGYADDGRVVVQSCGIISRLICQVDGLDDSQRQCHCTAMEVHFERPTGDVGVQTSVHQLVHVKVALEDPFLHSVGDLGLRHLTGRRLHDCHTLRTVVSRANGTQRRRGAGNGSPLGSRSEVLSEIVTFAC